MDIAFLKDIITNIGFPISCVIALGWYINKRDREQQEDKLSHQEILLDEIKFNREVNSELLETNKLLASDIKCELKDIKTILSDSIKNGR